MYIFLLRGNGWFFKDVYFYRSQWRIYKKKDFHLIRKKRIKEKRKGENGKKRKKERKQKK